GPGPLGLADGEQSRYQDETQVYQLAGELSQSGHRQDGPYYYEDYHPSHDFGINQSQGDSTPMLLSSSSLSSWSSFVDSGQSSGLSESTSSLYPDPPPALPSRAQESRAITPLHLPTVTHFYPPTATHFQAPAVTPFHPPTVTHFHPLTTSGLVGQPPTYPPPDLVYVTNPDYFQQQYPPYSVTNIGESSIMSAFRQVFKTGPNEIIRQKKRVVFLAICRQAVDVRCILQGKGEPTRPAVSELMERIAGLALYDHHYDLWLDVLCCCYGKRLKNLYHIVLINLGYRSLDSKSSSSLPMEHDRGLRELFDLFQKSRHHTIGYLRAPEKKLEKIVEDAEWLMTYILGHLLPTGGTNWAHMGYDIEDRNTMTDWKLGLLPSTADDVKSECIPYIDILGSVVYDEVHQQLHCYSQGVSNPPLKEYCDVFMTDIRFLMHLWHSDNLNSGAH
ncbi:hypothetical protein FIBSPDRAFT_903392, partial [Athelia psychrophila]